MRRSVLGLALCAALFGCSKAEDGLETEVGLYSLFDPVATNPALCGGPAIPFPNNALFADGTSPTGITTDTTLNIPSAASTAVAANLTDGFSTTASIFTDVLGDVDFASATNAIVIVEADATPRILVPGVDYTLQTSTALGQLSGTGGACSANPLAARFTPISQQRTRILIEPLKPLNASTTYIVGVTKALKSADGVAATPNEFFSIVNSDTKLCRLTGGETTAELLCTDSAAGAAAAAATGATVLANLDPGGAIDAATATVKLITLETLRRNLVRPTVGAFKSFQNALADPDLTDDDLVIAWSFTTQAISASLVTLNATQTAKTFSVAATGLSTGDLGIAGLADTADIFTGRLLAVPYYLNDAAATNDAASQLDFWRSANVVTAGPTGVFPAVVFDHDANPATAPIPAPCSGAPFNFAQSVSTTNCYRIPAQQSTEDLPVMVTVPNATCNVNPAVCAKPANGWKVVIFQHGITGNRTQMLPMGAALANAGFVTVAIDLPLHGLAGPLGPTNPFYQAGFERTFELDISAGSSCLSAPAGDGTTDPSGTCFINLGSLATTRDNNRQAVADLIHVVKSLMAADPMNLDAAAGDDIDETNIYFAGISLGSIVGTTLLAVNTDIKAASLSVPGGGLAKLLDASASFGPVIAGGLAGVAIATASSGSGSPFEGTDTYETFVRFAQHLSDPGDPINYAVAANTNHRIHLTEVIGDTVVPNSAMSTCPAASAFTTVTFPTALSNAAADTRDAACDASILLVGTNSTTAAACNGGVAVTTGLCAGNAAQDEVLISGFLSGTEPLFGEMGIGTVLGPITPPGTANNQANAGGFDAVVQFATGTHGSLLTPAPGVTFLAVTCEMQREAVTYLASNGTAMQVGGTCP